MIFFGAILAKFAILHFWDELSDQHQSIKKTLDSLHAICTFLVQKGADLIYIFGHILNMFVNPKNTTYNFSEQFRGKQIAAIYQSVYK